MSIFQSQRNRRRDISTVVDKFRAGKLVPVRCTPVRPSEGGMYSFNTVLELDPIAGRMITPIYAEVVSVFVPIQAADFIRDPEAAYAGAAEVIRQKLLTGVPLFDLEAENEITRRCGINPVSIAGQKQTNAVIRLSHNAAVNFLRTRQYAYASTILASNTAVTNALYSNSVLDRFDGVLDPDDRVNGAVQLQLPDMQLPVRNLGVEPVGTLSGIKEPVDNEVLPERWLTSGATVARGNKLYGIEAVSGSTQMKKIYAEFEGALAGNLSLSDFYRAEKMDKLTRVMRDMIDQHGEEGEEMALRWVSGLKVETSKTPFVIAEKRTMFGRNLVGALDSEGVNADVIRSDMAVSISFSVPVPQTELGGNIITFISVKPDETLGAQPHPIYSEPWGLDNFAADELAVDPEPVLVRQLDSECASGDETQVAFYTGRNSMKRNYVHYGLSRRLDPNTVENKTQVWQVEIPLSVDPDSILYPDYIDHYPFANGGTEAAPVEVVTAITTATVILPTPMIFGPSPVETVAIIDTADVFDMEAEE